MKNKYHYLWINQVWNVNELLNLPTQWFCQYFEFHGNGRWCVDDPIWFTFSFLTVFGNSRSCSIRFSSLLSLSQHICRLSTVCLPFYKVLKYEAYNYQKTSFSTLSLKTILNWVTYLWNLHSPKYLEDYDWFLLIGLAPLSQILSRTLLS